MNNVTGENMSLSTDEYEEYLNLSNKIADTFPTLIQGYDAQGNAILTCAGNVDKLTEAYRNLAHEEYSKVLDKADTIFKDFSSDVGNIEANGNNDALKALQDIMSGGDIDATMKKYAKNDTLMRQITNMFEEQGFERDRGDWRTQQDNESLSEFVKRMVVEQKSTANAILTNWDNEMQGAAADMKNLAEAYIGDALVSGNYSNISDSMQSVINGAVSNMDYSFFVDAHGQRKYKNEADMYADFNDMLDVFNNMGAEQQKSIEVAMELKTRYNNGDVTVSEYIDGIQDINNMIIGLDPDMSEMIKITLGLDIEDIQTDKEALKAKLTEELDMASENADDLIGTLTSGQLKLFYDLVLEGEIDESMINEFDSLMTRMKNKGIELEDVMRTTFGNIQLDENREVIKWTEETLSQYDKALKSWNVTNAQIKNMAGDISSTMSKTMDKDGIKIAFSPVLQTENGAELLSKDTVSRYLDSIISKAKEDDGKVDAAEILSFDMTGLEIDGKRISNIIASVGDEAQRVADIMNYAGADGFIHQTEAMQTLLREMKVAAALSYDMGLTDEAESFEVLNNALSETMSVTGLTEESMAKLQGRYSQVEVSGRRLNDVFDATAVGLRLNTDVLGEFEQALASQKVEEVTGYLETLEEELGRVESALASGDKTASDTSALMARRDAIIDQMNLLGKQAAMYEGLASKYTAWQNAEDAGSNRDLYESIIEGRENIGDELSRGWADDGTIKYLELMTDRTDLAGKSAKELRGIFNSLDNEINSSGFSVNDWFTVDDEGNSTAKGFYNFLDTINAEAGKVGDAVTKHKDGSYTFDFSVAGGDEAIAEALGVSEEIVHIMLQAGKDAGFEINFEGQFEHFSNIVSSAEQALKDFNKATGNDFKFDFGSSDFNTISEDLSQAITMFEKYKVYNEDGTLKLDTKEAEDAWEIVSTLQTRYDMLTDPAYMSLDASTVEEELREPVELLQEYDRLLAERHQLKAKGEIDTQAYKDNEEAMKNTFEYFKAIRDEGGELARDFQTIEGISLENLSDEELQAALDNQELTIPTELDITANIDDSLKKMLDLQLYQAGLKDKIEIPWMFEEATGSKIDGIDFEAYGDKKQIAIDFVTSEDNQEWLNSLNSGQRRLVVDFYMENTEILDKYDEDKKQIIFDYVASNPEVLDKYEGETKQVVIDFIANNEELLDKYEDPIEQQVIFDYVTNYGEESWNDLGEEGQEVVVNYIANHEEVDNYTPEEKSAIATYLADPSQLDNFTPEEKEAIARFTAEHEEVDDYNPEQKYALAKYFKDSAEVDNYVMPQDKNATATYYKDSSIPDSYEPKDKTATVTFWAEVKKKASDLWKWITGGGGEEDGSGADGTAHANGSAFAQGTINNSGRAFKNGNWGIKGSGTALVGELGQELVVRDGRYFTVGDNGAEFFDYRPNDIIFNAGQTRQLFEQGKIVNGKTRGRSVASGTAFASGKSNYGGKAFDDGSWGSGGGYAGDYGESSYSGSSPKSPSKSSSKASKEADEFLEKLDWIEVAIDRIERKIKKFNLSATSVFNNWSVRASSLAHEIKKVGEEIDLQERGAKRYLQEAESVGLSAEYMKKVQTGEIDIETITDENLKKKIEEYQQWYEKFLACKDAAEELRETEKELYAEKFDNIMTRYEGYLSLIEHEKSMLEEYISQSEAKGHVTSTSYYEALSRNEQESIKKLTAEKAELLAQLEENMASGAVAYKSEEWYRLVGEIDAVTLAIAQGETAMLEYAKTIRELEWGQFDMLQDKISRLTDESEFLIELMSNKKLYEDGGQLTDEGMATMGLHGQNYNVEMARADMYGAEAAKLKAQMAEDPLNQDLVNRYNEMIDLQREHILAAEGEKNAIRDMVEEGINLELEALQEKIDKYNEALESQKDMYDYQKKVKKQTEEIAALEKQMAAYAGDNSEEAKAKVQKLQVELEDAREALEETEYDKYISDQQEMLDTLYEEYETILNERLDNIDALMTDMIADINANSDQIEATLVEQAGNVGTTLSEEMANIWTGEGNVISEYGKDFSDKLTTTNKTLGDISDRLLEMIRLTNEEAAKKIQEAENSSAAGSEQARTPEDLSGGQTQDNTPKNETPKSSGSGSVSNDTLMGVASAIWVLGGSGSGWMNGDQRKQRLTTKLGASNAAKVQEYINKYGNSGKLTGSASSLSKYKYDAFKSGVSNLSKNQLAWTQEDGLEFIVRPSDGAILTPLAKGDSVLKAAASKNLWDMANAPSEFIRDSLGLSVVESMIGQGAQTTIEQNFENVSFVMPNVKNYEEMLMQMKKDKNFQRLIDSMGVDQIAGKSSMRKGKSIR